jgi:hypothetical protein
MGLVLIVDGNALESGLKIGNVHNGGRDAKGWKALKGTALAKTERKRRLELRLNAEGYTAWAWRLCKWA